MAEVVDEVEANSCTFGATMRWIRDHVKNLYQEYWDTLHIAFFFLFRRMQWRIIRLLFPPLLARMWHTWEPRQQLFSAWRGIGVYIYIFTWCSYSMFMTQVEGESRNVKMGERCLMWRNLNPYSPPSHLLVANARWDTQDFGILH